MTMYAMTDAQFQTVYNILSFSLASMMASTIFFWVRLPSIHEKYKVGLLISGLVTFIAAYHYMRIFNSWVESYEYTKTGGPFLTGVPFNDAYRYMDWLLTVPLLLMEIVLVMKIPEDEQTNLCFKLGVSSGLTIIMGYPGELLTEQDELSGRWMYWGLSMVPFCYVVYTLLVGLKAATESEADEKIRSAIGMAQWMTVISWLTYPVVYIIPMMGAVGAQAVVGIQVGYCISDIISKCGVGLFIYQISLAKSQAAMAEGFSPETA
jgi:bacteriorhodopsin